MKTSKRPVRGLLRLALALGSVTAAAVTLSGAGASSGGWWTPEQRPSPDSEVNVTGAPAKGLDDRGGVRGFVDLHNHLMSNEGFGGRLVCGKPFDEAGVAVALQDCPEHQPDGSGALFEHLTGGDDGTHDPVGWPTFKDWPSHKSLSHQQNYYAWVERAWRGGQRVLVTDMVTNGVICSLPILPRDRGCDEMESIRLQIRKTREMEAYIDRVWGGPGRGFFRIVTSPEQAREVIRDGKLAVVMGVETSEPFGCKQVLDVAQCSRADIDRGLDELHGLGVRSMFLCHKFDNALCGVRFDSGSIGTIINIGQFLSTGTFWRTERCRGPQQDNPIGASAQVEQTLGVDAPSYASDAQCNVRGLTRLGEYALNGMMDRGMLLEIDHMSVKAAGRALDILEAEEYAGIVSSHSWMDRSWAERVYRLGGMIGQYVFPAAEFATVARQQADLRDTHGVGLGFGADMNGLGGWPAPEGVDGPFAVAYPFRSLDGSATLDRQVTGERTWDVNTDGLAHYGLIPDWLEQVRRAGGQPVVDDLMTGAESYLQTWAGARDYQRGTDLARGAAATASSSEWSLFTSYAPDRAVDGDAGTRWASGWSDDQWLQVDLGQVRRVGRVTLDWEAAHASSYDVEVSTDGRTWQRVWSTTSGDGGLDTARFPAVDARYVRMHGRARATGWGYSLWEMSVYGD